MGQFEQIQTRKAISAYGGVGSLIESRDGSLLIENFDKWPYFASHDKIFKDFEIIVDKRFKNRISKYFTQLENFVRIPANDLQKVFRDNNILQVMSAKYFPKWFYCNSCRRFDRIENWERRWKLKVDTDDKEKFYPPHCPYCYEKGKQNNKRNFVPLEQVRFVMTAPTGEIADIPWDKWALFKEKKKKKGGENENMTEEEAEISLGLIEVPDGLKLKYSTSDKLDDLSGIGIEAIDENDTTINYSTLSGLFNLRVRIQEIISNPVTPDVLFKSVIRSSNSVYYPNILSSIFIPANDEFNENVIQKIREYFEDDFTISQILKVLKNENNREFSEESVRNLIENNYSEREAEIAKTENQYRFDEYKYFIEKKNENMQDKLIFNEVNPNYYQNELIKSIFKMDLVKITSVQTSFTRQEPIPYDSYLEEDDDRENNKHIIKKKYTSTAGLQTKYLPAIESYGEGIFFDFDNNVLNNWISANREVDLRIQKIIENHESLELNFNTSLKLTPKFILIHTFSHLIIKELEYLCGYPSTSLQERLYIDDELGMSGVMIYTVAGSEGSYGGITSLCDDEKIGKLIHSAINRALDCATDPICYHTDGQGVGNLNLSACFSCSLLPETSCEMFNNYLDRRILIDSVYGYFKSLAI